MHCHTACKITISTSLPKSSFRKQRVTASSCGSKLGTRRAKQRWSALVSAPTSRLAKYMRAHLGEALWADFVGHTNRFYKDTYVRAFQERPHDALFGECDDDVCDACASGAAHTVVLVCVPVCS